MDEPLPNMTAININRRDQGADMGATRGKTM